MRNLKLFFLVKVWWGYTDSAMVHYLEMANEWNIGVMTSHDSVSCDGPFDILSLFYDASGQLWKVRHTFMNCCIIRFFSRFETRMSKLLGKYYTKIIMQAL